jgi:hypothetical protein
MKESQAGDADEFILSHKFIGKNAHLFYPSQRSLWSLREIVFVFYAPHCTLLLRFRFAAPSPLFPLPFSI